MRLKPSPPGSSSLLATGFVALQRAPRSKTAQAERAHRVRSQEESDVDQEGVGTSEEPPRNAKSRQRTIREECASRKPDGRAFREEHVVRNTCTHAPSRRSSGNGGARERVEQKDVSRRHGRELLGRRVRTCVRRRRRKQWSGELFRSGGKNACRGKRMGANVVKRCCLRDDGLTESSNRRISTPLVLMLGPGPQPEFLLFRVCPSWLRAPNSRSEDAAGVAQRSSATASQWLLRERHQQLLIGDDKPKSDECLADQRGTVPKPRLWRCRLVIGLSESKPCCSLDTTFVHENRRDGFPTIAYVF